jgi:hypothetical protein
MDEWQMGWNEVEEFTQRFAGEMSTWKVDEEIKWVTLRRILDK